MNVLLIILYTSPTLQTFINLIINAHPIYFQSNTLSIVPSPYDTFTLNKGVLSINNKILCHHYGSSTVNMCSTFRKGKALRLRTMSGCLRVGTDGMCVSVYGEMVGMKRCGEEGQCVLVQEIQEDNDNSSDSGRDRDGRDKDRDGKDSDKDDDNINISNNINNKEIKSGRRYKAGYDERGMVNLNGHDSRKGINNDDNDDDEEGGNNNNINNDNINDDNINSNINNFTNNDNNNDGDSDNSTNPATDANTSTINGTDPFDSPSYDLSRVQQSIDDGFHILTKTNPEMRFNIKRVIPVCFNGYESMDEYLRDVLPNVTKRRKKYCYNEFYDISKTY